LEAAWVLLEDIPSLRRIKTLRSKYLNKTYYIFLLGADSFMKIDAKNKIQDN
jgi:nicotinic acid mononucleotide adenylyltransferase